MFKRSPLLLAAVTGALMLGVAGTALAVDRVSFEYGTTDDDRASADRYGATVAWNLGGEWLKLGQFSLTTYIEAGLNVWDGDKGTTGNGTNVDGHVTPVLRLQRDLASNLPVFIEAGAGFHGYSDTKIDGRDFDIPFAFGSHFGAGLRFGPGAHFEVMYRYQHQSNAGLGDDNPGINFHLVSLGYHF